VRDAIVAGLTWRNRRRAVKSVVNGSVIEKPTASREFAVASAAELGKLRERELDRIDLVAIRVDGIHSGNVGQPLACSKRKKIS
jgi:hypothetical protein